MLSFYDRAKVCNDNRKKYLWQNSTGINSPINSIKWYRKINVLICPDLNIKGIE